MPRLLQIMRTVMILYGKRMSLKSSFLPLIAILFNTFSLRSAPRANFSLLTLLMQMEIAHHWETSFMIAEPLNTELNSQITDGMLGLRSDLTSLAEVNPKLGI